MIHSAMPAHGPGNPVKGGGLEIDETPDVRESTMKWLSAMVFALLLFGSAASAQEQGDALPSGFESAPVLKSGETADGDPIKYPQTDSPEIVSVVGTLQPGGRTARHQHPIPVFVYVLEGELEVQTEGRDARSYKAGDAFMESVNTWHQAHNKGSAPAKILVVFMGEAGKPTTIAAQ